MASAKNNDERKSGLMGKPRQCIQAASQTTHGVTRPTVCCFFAHISLFFCRMPPQNGITLIVPPNAAL
jgi:hypothetical protein